MVPHIGCKTPTENFTMSDSQECEPKMQE
uniref:Uncharacterized protein n=1 Tax=Rhizophora mucronata TaxID=61149 RepID=A0A2P2P553_RHIMU